MKNKYTSWRTCLPISLMSGSMGCRILLLVPLLSVLWLGIAWAVQKP